ncbi:PAXIP1-associated glutamate-rich protein 1 [Carcharodon carcharias]|uniref:PAXIP1-associated glutamate-rich protein 1 n=1 Tax=Carcharodon carcharias TaxID=13397 RepID=UPI001B7DA1E9|nr:PAXIP1-associated glutamate-rich protein 1 [Carcharodon carcharias]
MQAEEMSPAVSLTQLALDSEETWCVGCSDEEVEDPEGWRPGPQEVRRLYQTLEERGRLELSTRPFPRRPPTPEAHPQEEGEEEEEEADPKAAEE